MKKKALLRAVFFFFLFALSTKRAVSSWNDASRMATIQSLVEYRTLAIDGSEFVDLTSDKYLYQGKFYSSKPPLLAVMVTPIYAVLRLLGISFGSQPALAYYLTTLLSVGVISAIGLGLLWYMWITEFGVNERWADLAILLVGAGTLYLPFSTVFNSHSVSAVFLLIAFYFVLKARKEAGVVPSLWVGLTLAAAGAIDPSLLVFLPVGFLLIYRQHLRRAIAFLVASVPILLLAGAFNVSKSGSVLPPTLNAPLRDYAGSEFREQELSGLASHDDPVDVLVYAYHSTLGNRGLFSHSPVLLFSIVGAVIFWQGRRKLPFSVEYAWFGLGCLMYFALYLFQTTNYSGEAFGVRWFVSLMLILGIPLGILESRLGTGRSLRIGFFTVAALSIGLSVLGSYRPFLPLADFVPGEPGIVENSILAALDRFLNEASTAGQLRTLLLGLVSFTAYLAAFFRWNAFRHSMRDSGRS